MTDEETETIMKSANDCVEGECSVDEVSELLSILKETEKELESRMESIMNMIAHLQHINKKEERKTDDVRAFVQDMLRVFNTDVSFGTLFLRPQPIYSRVVNVHTAVAH